MVWTQTVVIGDAQTVEQLRIILFAKKHGVLISAYIGGKRPAFDFMLANNFLMPSFEFKRWFFYFIFERGEKRNGK
jgi:hypothetical protein